MKKTRGTRWLSLLLALAVCLTLAPAAWAADNSVTIIDPAEGTLVVKKGTERNLRADPGVGVAWESSDRTVVSVNNSTSSFTANKPGTANIYAFLRSNPEIKSAPLVVTVSGIAVPDSYTLPANSPPKDLSIIARDWCVGDADPYSLEFSSLDTDIVEIDDGFITGLRAGEAEVEIRYGFQSSSGTEIENLKVIVEKDPSTVIDGGTLATNDTLDFGGLKLPTRLNDSAVVYVNGLYVPTDQGTLYYDYRSEAEPGAGVGQSQSYYINPDPGQRALRDVTFVPKSSYPGGKVTITFTAITEDFSSYACEINLTVEGISGDGSAAGGISLNTNYASAVQFDSIEFGAVCREKLGVQLDYVIFSQPPERQGTLYTNYASSGSYGSVVDVHRQYSRREIDDIWFVPAPGYSGSVTVYYTAFGTNGKSYSGQVIITVEQEDQIATGGLSYNTSPGRAARFDGDDFDEYCWNLLNQEQTLSGIRFESLPSESDGVLYYDYRTTTNPGVRAEAGTVFYYGSRTPSIDRLAFVPSEDFTGTLKLPFTGWTTDGTSFSGNVEINVRGSVITGDIYYFCIPGSSVSFLSSDFTGLSRALTNRTLNYIRLLNLPDTSEGYLYFGSARVNSTETNYTSGNIGRLNFRASNSFSGLVNLPFEGRSTGGDTFTGVISIGDGTGGSGSTGGTSGSSGTGGTGGSGILSTEHVTARYSTRTALVRLNAGDLAQSGTGLSSIQFTSLPSSSAGYLYYQYSSPVQYGQQVSTGATFRTSGGNLISSLAFLPRAGYSGTVVIPYTGTNTNGSTFTGEVEITVSPSYSSSYFNDMAGYGSDRLAAVDFLYDHNVTRGMAAGQYGPELSLRRGDFALMVYQAFEFPFDSHGHPFIDVPDDAYYTRAVEALYVYGVVSGTGNGYYQPNGTLTRQDAVCMVQRAMQAIGWSASDGYAGTLDEYSDGGSVSGYARGAMAMAAQRGLLPTTGNMLNPLQPLTRVEMAELLHRALTY